MKNYTILKQLNLQAKFPNLDFVLFGSYCNGMPQIFYIDRESYKYIGEFADLEIADLHLSPLKSLFLTYTCQFVCDIEAA